MKILTRWLINASALLLMAYYLPGLEIAGAYAALIAALIFGLINAFIGTILKIITLPIGILTLGLSTFIINAALFWVTSTIVKGFGILDFKTAFIGAFILWIVSWISNLLLKD